VLGKDFERNGTHRSLGSRLKAQLIMLLIEDTKLKFDDITRSEATKAVYLENF